MAYEVTATRRRPGRFEDMIGQDFVVATLRNSVAAGKIAHAYLFSGPRGCGKTSSARILAKALNCEKGPTATPCGVCPACVEIARGASLDVIEIDGASNTSVNDVRQIKDEVQFPPNAYRYKVYIIDEVHMLSTSAFNALLKTIEEPPPYVVFVFATTELHKVPATIKSRCQQFNFRLVGIEVLRDALAEAARESGIEAEEEALLWIAREATGSVRDAYTLFDQVAAFSDGSITFEKIRDKLGLVGIDRINEIVDACVAKDAAGALSSLDAIIASGVSVDQLVADLAEFFRSLLLLKSGVEKESLIGHPAERFSAAARERWSAAQVERGLALALQLHRDVRYSLDPRYELELTVSRLAWLSDYVSPGELRSAVERARSVLAKGAAPLPESAPSGRSGPFDGAERPSREDGLRADEARIDDPFASLKQSWTRPHEAPSPAIAVTPTPTPTPVPVPAPAPEPEPEPEPPRPPVPSIGIDALSGALVARFQETKNMVATALAQATDWSEDGGTVRFSVDRPFVRTLLEQEHRAIAEAARDLLGKPVSIEIALVERAASDDPAEDGGVPAQVELVRRMFKGTVITEGRNG
ncbi:MAG TPA: DNA polymerase III subunit gamma/tau [Treponemataceae bacterium]|mgnify:CR=1 FL=1|nr:DNA polymerase III subunit gamma/tau [Treponemataceae bacterium]